MDTLEGQSVIETRIKFPARDGFDLGGMLFAPGRLAHSNHAVVINCGGGIPAVRYANFARFLAKAGIPVLTYDYRGIGSSRPTSLRGFRATVEDWSEYDCAGAIDFIHARFAASAIVGAAHSIGAFLMGAAPNVGILSRFFFVGAHTGYFGDYRPLYRWPMAVLWHGVMPLLTQTMGYFPGRRLRLGEDIPRDVALQWAARRTADPKARKSTASGTSRSEVFFRRCASTKVPALMLGFTDDAFATAAGAHRFLSEFPRVVASHVELAPTQIGLQRIGHFGFFSRVAESELWPIALAYIRDGVVPKLPYNGRVVSSAPTAG